MNKGVYIALEGMDGVGKSTVMPYISDYLKSIGRDVVEVREPGSTPLGERIRELLKSDCPMTDKTTLLLMMSAHCELVHDVVLPALKEGKVVLSDRCYISALAYQGKGAGVAYKALGLDTLPDYLYVLKLPLDTAIKRRGNDDRFELKDYDYQLRVWKFYDKLDRSYISRKYEGRVKGIDASKSAPYTAIQIVEHLQSVGLS